MSTNANTSGTDARSPVAAVSREDEVAPVNGAGIELSESPSSSPSSDAESVLPASVAPEGEPGAEDTSAIAGCKRWMQDYDWLRREVPEGIAFALVAGVEPINTLHGSWILCVVTTLIGGQPGMVSAAAGAMAVVVAPLVSSHGVGYMIYAVIVGGLLQIVVGLLRLARVMMFVPHSVMVGFVNGLALVIFLAQVQTFKIPPESEETGSDTGGGAPGSFAVFTDSSEWITDGVTLAWMFAHVAVTVLISVVFPRLTKAIPSALVALLFGTFLEHAFIRQIGDFETRTIGDVADVAGGLPKIAWINSEVDMPPLSWDVFVTVFPVGVTYAIVGLLESMLTLQLVDGILNREGRTHKEAIAQGVGNILATSLASSMGGDVMLGQTMLNVKSGGVTQWSTGVAALAHLLIIVVASPLIRVIPTASLAGVMLMVVYHTFEWESLGIIMVSAQPARVRNRLVPSMIRKIRRTDAFIILVVTVVTLFTNLAVAVGCGILIACLEHIWYAGHHVRVQKIVRNHHETGLPVEKIYRIQGPVFFASVKHVRKAFTPNEDPDDVVLDLESSDLRDFSALEALNTLAGKYQEQGKSFRIVNIQEECWRHMTKARDLLTNLDHDSLSDEVDRLREVRNTVQEHHDALERGVALPRLASWEPLRSDSPYELYNDVSMHPTEVVKRTMRLRREDRAGAGAGGAAVIVPAATEEGFSTGSEGRPSVEEQEDRASEEVAPLSPFAASHSPRRRIPGGAISPQFRPAVPPLDLEEVPVRLHETHAAPLKNDDGEE